MNTLGEQIRYHRELKGYSQADLAHELDISLNAYSRIERNITDVNYSRLLQIAKVLKITVVELLLTDKKGKMRLDQVEELKKSVIEKDKKIMALQNQIIALLGKENQLAGNKTVKKKASRKKKG